TDVTENWNNETTVADVALDRVGPTITIDTPTTSSPVYRKSGELFYVNFTYTEENPANYTVNIYNSTAVINTTTVNYPAGGTDQVANVSFYLNSSAADGFYNVSVEMYDNTSIYNYTAYQNNSVVKDDTSPTITIDTPTTSSPVYRKSGELFYVNFTYTEENPANYTVEIYNSTAVINTTTVNYPAGGTDQVANESFYLNTSAADGQYNVSVGMFDNSSNYTISYQNNSVVKGVYNASISQPANQTTVPHVNATYELKITNTGNFTDTFTLAVVQIDSVDVAELNTTTISNLAVGESRNVTLNVTDADGGTHNVTVNVTSSVSGSEVANTNYIMTNIVPITVTFISQYPAAIAGYNTTGPFNVTWLVTTGTDGLDNDSISLVWTVFDTIKEDYVWSLRVPSNDLAELDPYFGENILRADNRNGSLNFENNDTITEGNVWKWAGADINTSRLTVQKINSTHSYVYWNGTIDDTIFQNTYYLSRDPLLQETSKYYNVSKNNSALIKIWDVKAAKGSNDYNIQILFNITNKGTPADSLQVYYLNESYVINGSKLPHEDSLNGTYLTAYNGTAVDDYTYVSYNSSFVRLNINVENGSMGVSQINVTPNGYLLFKSITPEDSAYQVGYVNGSSGTNLSFAETEVAWTSSNNGATFLQAEWTPKLIFLSFDDQIHMMNLYAADTLGRWGNSTILENEIGEVEYKPTTPDINHFNYLGAWDYNKNGTYTGIMGVATFLATDPDGGNVTHNLTLHYTNGTLVPNGIINNTLDRADLVYDRGVWFACVPFNTNNYSAGEYTMQCVATDDEGDTSDIWLDHIFTLDHQSPTMTIDEPTTSSPIYRIGGEEIWVNFTYTEENPKSYTVEIYNSTAVINTTTVNYPAGGTNQVANVSFYLNTSAADGRYNVSVKMHDNTSLNNYTAYQNYSVVKDTTAPDVTAITVNQWYANNSVVTLNASITDDSSGVKNATVNVSAINSTLNEVVLVKQGGDYWTNATVIADRGDTGGLVNLTITAYDNVSLDNNSLNMTAG
ncbi:MAG: VCBS domain-containing protein, partial [Methanocellales archaeon]|nr:VCBS domain-containing protein [Methanocellales archaeon]